MAELYAANILHDENLSHCLELSNALPIQVKRDEQCARVPHFQIAHMSSF
jgi:hypothetical protein